MTKTISWLLKGFQLSYGIDRPNKFLNMYMTFNSRTVDIVNFAVNNLLLFDNPLNWPLLHPPLLLHLLPLCLETVTNECPLILDDPIRFLWFPPLLLDHYLFPH